MENLIKIANHRGNAMGSNPPITQISYTQINELNDLQIHSVAGESYDHIVFNSNTKNIFAITADGKKYVYTWPQRPIQMPIGR